MKLLKLRLGVTQQLQVDLAIVCADSRRRLIQSNGLAGEHPRNPGSVNIILWSGGVLQRHSLAPDRLELSLSMVASPQCRFHFARQADCSATGNRPGHFRLRRKPRLIHFLLGYESRWLAGQRALPDARE